MQGDNLCNPHIPGEETEAQSLTQRLQAHIKNRAT